MFDEFDRDVRRFISFLILEFIPSLVLIFLILIVLPLWCLGLNGVEISHFVIGVIRWLE